MLIQAGAGGSPFPRPLTTIWMGIPDGPSFWYCQSWHGQAAPWRHHSHFQPFQHIKLFSTLSPQLLVGMFVSLGLLLDVLTSLCSPQGFQDASKVLRAVSGQAEPTSRLNPHQGSSISPIPVWRPGHLQMFQVSPQHSLTSSKHEISFLSCSLSCHLLELWQVPASSTTE